MKLHKLQHTKAITFPTFEHVPSTDHDQDLTIVTAPEKHHVFKSVKRRLRRISSSMHGYSRKRQRSASIPDPSPSEPNNGPGNTPPSTTSIYILPSAASPPSDATSSSRSRDDDVFAIMSTPGQELGSHVDPRIAEAAEEDASDDGRPMLSVYVEPEVPQPFLIDDEADGSASPSSARPISPTNMNLASPLLASPSLPSPNLNKDVPPPPSESDGEEEVHDVYLPELVIPTMFLPIPNTDPLTTLLTKYIHPPDKRPVRDLSGEWQNSSFHSLVMTNSWRALARMARDRIVTTDPQDLALVLGLWYLRLACLSRLRLFNQTSAECTNLFSILNGIEPPEAKAWVFDRVLPFELEVMQARLKYWAGDHMGYLDALNLLLKKCRSKARSVSDDVNVGMWKERGARLCLIIASQMMEMKDFGAAGKLLEPLCDHRDPSEKSPALRSAIGRIYLQGGYLSRATTHFAAVDADPNADQSLKDMNKALLASANGQWKFAGDTLRSVLEKDPENYVAVNNLSVALLSQGKLKDGIETLERALKTSPSSVVVAEPFLFNLSTLYELRSATATEKKLNLLVEVAKWSGDGLKTTCLKMPSN